MPIRRAGESARGALGYAPMRQSNLQNRHGARNSDFLLSGVGAISRNTPHLREQKNSCVTVDWRKKRSNGTLVCFFFVLFLSNKEKGHRSPLSKEFLKPFAEKRSKINKNLFYLSKCLQEPKDLFCRTAHIFPRGLSFHRLGERTGPRHDGEKSVDGAFPVHLRHSGN